MNGEQEPSDATLADTVSRQSDGSRHGGSGPAAALPGRLAHHVLLEEIGRGGMGVVYAAKDPRLDRKVAIKTLHAPDDVHSRARLVHEAKALARLTHPNVVRVYEIGEVEGETFIVMEFVEGRTLRAWLDEQPRSLAQILEVVRAAGRGLAAIHAAGLIHRDVKPDNLMLDDHGRVLVMDLGIARSDSDDGTRDESKRDASSNTHQAQAQAQTLTRTGTLMGSPAYMAPEQFRAGPITAKVDQFSLCVTLWEAVYGERPFAGNTIAQLMRAVSEGQLREPQGSAPAWLTKVLERGLAADPDARFESMTALVDALVGPSTGRARAVGTGLVVVLGLALAAFVWLRSSSKIDAVGPASSTTPALDTPGTRAAGRAPEPPTPAAEAGETLAPKQRARRIALAPSGRELVYVADAELWHLDLDSRDERRLVPEQVTEAWFSPDGALWYADADAPSPQLMRMGELDDKPQRFGPRLGDSCLLASRGRLIMADPDTRSLRVFDLDGRELRRIELDEAVDELGCDDAHARVAALIELDVGHRLLSIELDGGATRVLLEHGEELRQPRFDAAGETLYYVATRGLGPQLEALTFDQGRPVPQRVVLPDVRVDDYDFDRAGRMAYLSITGSWQLFEVGPGQTTLAEARMILSSRADMIGWTLSPDDRSIGYVESWGAMGRLSIQPVAGGPARELTAALNNVDLAWSPDGERIVYVAQHRGELRLWTIEVETGATTVHEGTRASSSSLLLLWPTPTRIVYTRAGVGYRVLELESGAERALLHDASPGPFYRAVPSPDGQRLAVHWDREPRGVWTLDLERGDAQLVVAGRYYPTDWSADGRELLLFDFDKPEQLSRVDAEGGPARTWRATPSGKRRPICMIGLDDALVCGFESSERTLGLVTLPRP